MNTKKINTYLPHSGKTFHQYMPSYGKADITFKGKGKVGFTIQVVSAPSKTWGYVAHAYIYSPLFASIHKQASGCGYDKMGNAVARALDEAVSRNGHQWKYGNVFLDKEGPREICIPKKMIALMEELSKEADCGNIGNYLRSIKTRRGISVKVEGGW